MNYYKKFKQYLTETLSDILSQSEDIKISKKISKLSKDDARIKYPNVIELYDKLISIIKNASYNKSVTYINRIIQDPKLKFLLSLNTKNFNEYQLLMTDAVLPVKSLIPIQCEIGLKHTLDKITFNSETVKYSKNDIIDTTIVVFNHKYIVDGHHRWCRIFMINPDARVRVINIIGNLSITDLLKAIQCSIGVNNNELNLVSNKSSNIFTVSKKQLYNRIIRNIPAKTLNEMKQIFNDPVKDLINNCMMIQNIEKLTYKIYRNEMPQFSHDSLKKIKKSIVSNTRKLFDKEL